jgi:hypothetical protein
MKQLPLIIITSIILIFLGVISFSNVSMAAPQTLTILGAQGNPGETDPNTKFSLDNGQTWNHAYLYGSHPWGQVSGTNSWINCGPSGTDYCVNRTVLYRTQFNVPEGFTDPHMNFEVKADNYADVYINGTFVMRVTGAGALIDNATANNAVHLGLNEVKLFFTDEGGWSGINYKITLNVDASTAPTIINTVTDTIAPTTTDNAPVNWVNQEITVNLTATDNPNGSGVATTYYTLDDGAPQTGTSVVLTAEGAHTIEYWSVDNAGNIEVKHSKTVNVKLLPLDRNGQFHINDVVHLINQGTLQEKEMNGDGIFDYKDIIIMLKAITPMVTSMPTY